MPEMWYHYNRYSYEIQEREVISFTAKFVTPVPTGMWAKSRPSRTAIGDEWFRTKSDAVRNAFTRMKRQLQAQKEQVSRLEANVAKFTATYAEEIAKLEASNAGN